MFWQEGHLRFFEQSGGSELDFDPREDFRSAPANPQVESIPVEDAAQYVIPPTVPRSSRRSGK